MTDNKPIARFRAGSLTAALWANKVNFSQGNRSLLKVTVERRYRDAQSKWHTTSSFTRNEVPLAIHLLYHAFGDMVRRETEADKDRDVQAIKRHINRAILDDGGDGHD